MWNLIVTYDFDLDSKNFVFETKEKAVNYMRAMWKQCVEEERRENPDALCEEHSRCDEEQLYAVITWDDGELTHRYFDVIQSEQPEPLKWEKLDAAFTPGGDPAYRCPVCREDKSVHAYGVESFDSAKDQCPVCGVTLWY